MIVNNAETFNHQTITKSRKSLVGEPITRKATLSFHSPLQYEQNWWISEKPSLEVFNSAFNITEKNENFKFFMRNYIEESSTIKKKGSDPQQKR